MFVEIYFPFNFLGFSLKKQRYFYFLRNRKFSKRKPEAVVTRLNKKY